MSISVLAKLRLKTGSPPPTNITLSDWQKGATFLRPDNARTRVPVERSDDLARIERLIRRTPVELEPDEHGNFSTEALALVQLMNGRLRLPPRACACASMGRPCIMSLLPTQAWALYESAIVGGLFGAIGVGHGKTGLDILTAMVMKNCKLAVLFIPPGLKEQLVAAYKLWREHWKVPSLVVDGKGYIIPGRPVLHVLPFSKLSRPEFTDALEKLGADLFIVDEAHNFRHRDTARTARALRYLAAFQETRLCVWSGTMTSESIKDYAHLAAFALKEGSPVPLEPSIVEEWSTAVDPSDWPAPAGSLRSLCKSDETLYQGFQRRLKETRGWISTKGGAIDASLYLHEREPPTMPMIVREMLDNMRATGVRPDGEELVGEMEIARNARELACGFYYYWIFPHGEPESLIEEWFAARKEWHKELREQLKNRIEHLDSPQLLTLAAERAYRDPPYEGDLPTWPADCYLRWVAVKDKVYHETKARWVDDWLARDASEWAKKHRGIVWYGHEAFGLRVAELSGLPMHGGGPGAEARILAEKGDRSIIASIDSHGTGRDGLQYLFNNQLMTTPPASAQKWEQILGRLHRIGQPADEVTMNVYRHTEEMAAAIDKAVVRAKYIEGTMGNLQKLLVSDCSFPLDND